jgi:hypothetical protein
MSNARVAGLALVIFAIASIAWFALELAPQGAGFADTDNPAVSLNFLARYGMTYAYSALALFTMAAALVVGALGLSERLAPTSSALAARVATSIGLAAALFFFGHGVLRNSVGPMLHIEGLDPVWGQSAYLAVQMAGLHGFAQGGIVAFSAWAVMVSILGVTSGSIPRWLAVLGILPAFRLLTSLLGPLEVLNALGDALWLASMASIVGSFIWPLALGVWLLLRTGRPIALARG